MRIAYHVMSAPGPLGLLFLARTEQGLRYLEFLDKRSIKRTIESRRAENSGATWEASLIDLKDYVDQLEGYFCGAITAFELRLDPVGTPFQHHVWSALRAIPFGETRNYGQIAKTIGQPRASRAVGLANNQNPIAIVVPCHRVIGADGNLTGYGGGLPRKRWLLSHETHFGGLAGVTLDLFAATGSMPIGRIASGDGPPLGLQRQIAAKPVVRAVATGARTTAKPAGRVALSGARTIAKPPVRAAALRTRATAKTSARPRPKAAPRSGVKLAARPARSSKRAAR